MELESNTTCSPLCHQSGARGVKVQVRDQGVIEIDYCCKS